MTYEGSIAIVVQINKYHVSTTLTTNLMTCLSVVTVSCDVRNGTMEIRFHGADDYVIKMKWIEGIFSYTLSWPKYAGENLSCVMSMSCKLPLSLPAKMWHAFSLTRDHNFDSYAWLHKMTQLSDDSYEMLRV